MPERRVSEHTLIFGRLQTFNFFFSYVNKYDGPFVAVVVCLYHYRCVGVRMHQDVAHFGV